MDRDQGYMDSNAEPRAITLPSTVIGPTISGITQRTGHEIAFITTSNRDAGANMRAVGRA